MKRITPLLLLIPMTLTSLLGYEEAFERTNKGKIEVKTIPSLHMIEATDEKGYFDADNKMFRKLFRYISENDIAMTTPVTVDVSPGSMRFIVGQTDEEKAEIDTTDVSVIRVPERTVVSIGYNGSYTQRNYEKHLKTLQAWLKEHQDTWQATGEPIAVYWDGPFKLPAWKKAEILIPIAPETPEARASTQPEQP